MDHYDATLLPFTLTAFLCSDAEDGFVQRPHDLPKILDSSYYEIRHNLNVYMTRIMMGQPKYLHHEFAEAANTFIDQVAWDRDQLVDLMVEGLEEIASNFTTNWDHHDISEILSHFHNLIAFFEYAAKTALDEIINSSRNNVDKITLSIHSLPSHPSLRHLWISSTNHYYQYKKPFYLSEGPPLGDVEDWTRKRSLLLDPPARDERPSTTFSKSSDEDTYSHTADLSSISSLLIDSPRGDNVPLSKLPTLAEDDFVTPTSSFTSSLPILPPRSPFNVCYASVPPLPTELPPAYQYERDLYGCTFRIHLAPRLGHSFHNPPPFWRPADSKSVSIYPDIETLRSHSPTMNRLDGALRLSSSVEEEFRRTALPRQPSEPHIFMPVVNLPKAQYCENAGLLHSSITDSSSCTGIKSGRRVSRRASLMVNKENTLVGDKEGASL